MDVNERPIYYASLKMFHRHPTSIFCIIATEFCERFSFCGLRSKRVFFKSLIHVVVIVGTLKFLVEYFCSNFVSLPEECALFTRKRCHSSVPYIYYDVLRNATCGCYSGGQFHRTVQVSSTDKITAIGDCRCEFRSQSWEVSVGVMTHTSNCIPGSRIILNETYIY